MVLVGKTDWLPELAVSDVQVAGEAAWQEVALVLDQVRVDELPAVIDSGEADIVTVGGTFTVTGELLVLPQPLRQVRI